MWVDYWGGGGKGYVAPCCPPPLSNYWGGPGPPSLTPPPPLFLRLNQNKVASKCTCFTVPFKFQMQTWSRSDGKSSQVLIYMYVAPTNVYFLNNVPSIFTGTFRFLKLSMYVQEVSRSPEPCSKTPSLRVRYRIHRHFHMYMHVHLIHKYYAPGYNTAWCQ